MLPIQYQITRSRRRKTVSLQVKNGELRVLAPEYVDQSFIVDLVRQKDAWIRAKINQQKALQKRHPRPQLEAGCTLLYRGDSYSLEVAESKIFLNAQNSGESIEIDSINFSSESITSDHLKEILLTWYLKQANEFLPQRLKYWSQTIGLEFNQLKIRRYKSRWGSCNSKKDITLNSLLMMAPTWVIDYVIVHELCHLVHLNHSQKFWHLVAQHCPNYQAAKLWFKQQRCNLHLFD